MKVYLIQAELNGCFDYTTTLLVVKKENGFEHIKPILKEKIAKVCKYYDYLKLSEERLEEIVNKLTTDSNYEEIGNYREVILTKELTNVY